MNGGFFYECDEETLKKYMATSIEWRLNWLEEMNVLTIATLTPQELQRRNAIRRGEI